MTHRSSRGFLRASSVIATTAAITAAVAFATPPVAAAPGSTASTVAASFDEHDPIDPPIVGADACTVTGSFGDDRLIGSDGDDVICGFEGNDVIEGRGGNDVIIAGGGNDVVDGGSGDDVIVAGAGSDRLSGGPGNDLMIGERDGDRLVHRGSSSADSVSIQGGDVVSDDGRDRFSGFDVIEIDLLGGDDSLTIEPMVGVQVLAVGGSESSLDRLNVIVPPDAAVSQSVDSIVTAGRGTITFQGFELVRARERWLIESARDESVTIGTVLAPGLTVDLLGGSDRVALRLDLLAAPVTIDDTGADGVDTVAVAAGAGAESIVVDASALRAGAQRLGLSGVERLELRTEGGDDRIVLLGLPLASYLVDGGPGVDTLVVSTPLAASYDPVRAVILVAGSPSISVAGIENVRVESGALGIQGTSTTSARIVAPSGQVVALSGATHHGDLAGVAGAAVVGIATTRSGDGYWLARADGAVDAFGDALGLGDMRGVGLVGAIVDIERTASGKGYYLLGSDGGIFTFGDAVFRGSMGGTALVRPVIDLVVHPGGEGYWLVAADGGVFTFTAGGQFHGSLPSLGITFERLNAPIVGGAASPTGLGYWMFGGDGGVFAFGDAGPFGSLPGVLAPGARPAPVVAGAPTPAGDGYWLLGRDGGVFTFGAAGFPGSGVGSGPAEFVALAAAAG